MTFTLAAFSRNLNRSSSGKGAMNVKMFLTGYLSFDETDQRDERCVDRGIFFFYSHTAHNKSTSAQSVNEYFCPPLNFPFR